MKKSLVFGLLVLALFTFNINYANASVSFSRDLRVGVRGSDVKVLQQFLKEEGYYTGRIDGIYGKKTARIVKEFQDDYDLPITGIVDSNTEAKINEVANDNGDDTVTTTPPTPTDPAYPNQNPVISGVSGPQSIGVNKQGTWTVKAYSNSKENLIYSADWGDQPADQMYTSTSRSISPAQQSATFTHSYLQPGIYTPTFTVQNQSGRNPAQTSITVNVGGVASSSITITSPQNNSSLNTAPSVVTWTKFPSMSSSGEYYIELKAVNASGYSFGDVIGSANQTHTSAGCGTSNVCSFYLYSIYPQGINLSGTYSVVVTAREPNNIVISNSASSTFTVNGETKSSLTIFSPNGGETWAVGTNQKISWGLNGSVPCLNGGGGSCLPTVPSSYNIELASYYPPCLGDRCPTYAYHAPYTIAKNVQGNFYDWVVGRRLAEYYNDEKLAIPEGSYIIRVCMVGRDICGESGSYFKIINNKTQTLSITTPSVLPPATVGVPYSVYFEASWIGNAGYKYNWRLNSALPPYYAFKDIRWGNKCDGEICGPFTATPTKAGTYTFTLAVYAGDQKAGKEFTLVVNPQISVGNIGVNYPKGGETWTKGVTQTISWFDGGTSFPCPISNNTGACPPVTYDIKLTPYYPPCVDRCTMSYRMPYTIAQVSGSSYDWYVGKTWEVDSAPDGRYTIQVCRTGTDTCGESRSFFNISSSVSGISITTQSPLPNAKVGVNTYQAHLFTSVNYDTLNLVSGSLPTGFVLGSSDDCNHLSSCFLITGTPTTVGTYNFTLQVGSGNALSNKSFTLTVDPAQYGQVTAYSSEFVNNQNTYTPSQSIKFSVKAIASDMLSGTPEKGLNVQAYMSDSVGNTVQVGGVYQAVNATYNYSTSLWDVVMTAPTDVSMVYKVTTAFYCGSSVNNSCANNQVERSFYFTLSNVIVPTNPLVINASRNSASPGGYIQVGQTGAELFKIDVSVSGQSSIMRQFNFELAGSGVKYISNIQAYVDGVVVGNLSDLVNTNSWYYSGNINMSVAIPAGSTKTFSIRGDVSPSVWSGVSTCDGCTQGMWMTLTGINADDGKSKVSGLPVPGNTVIIPFSAPLGLNSFGSMLSANALDGFTSNNPVSVVTPITPSFKFTQFLEQGSYGLEVRELQKVLAKAGYYTGNLDSIFGSGVKSALIKFQIAHSLKADGIVGYEMRTFLNR